MPSVTGDTTTPADTTVLPTADVGDTTTPADTAALPVAVDVDERLALEVRDHAEGVLGWQPVDAATAILVPPMLRLVTPGTPVRDDDVPCVLLLPEGTTAADAARAGASQRAAVTVAWPAERDTLAERVGPLLAAPRPHRIGEVVHVAGAAGGVGTSTVALALAGLAAWRGARVLAVLAPGAPAARVRTVEPAAVEATDLFGRATPLPGVPGARAVMLSAPVSAGVRLGAAGADLVVVDAGRSVEGDVLVCRPDRAALEQLATTTAGAVVVNGQGAASPRAVMRAAGGRRLVTLPWSTRVARAGLAGRVPASLPGSWLRRLAPLAHRPAAGGG
jgi:hypothetical protein